MRSCHGQASDSPQRGDIQEIALSEALEEKRTSPMRVVGHQCIARSRTRGDGSRPCTAAILMACGCSLDPGHGVRKSADSSADVMGIPSATATRRLRRAGALAQDFSRAIR